MFKALFSLVENSQLRTMEDEELENWPKVTKFLSKTWRLFIVFEEISLRVVVALGLKRTRGLTSPRGFPDGNTEVEKRKLWSDMFSSSTGSFRRGEGMLFENEVSGSRRSRKLERLGLEQGIRIKN